MYVDAIATMTALTSMCATMAQATATQSYPWPGPWVTQKGRSGLDLCKAVEVGWPACPQNKYVPLHHVASPHHYIVSNAA